MHRNYAQSIDAIQVALRDASKPHGVHVRADHGGCTCHRPPTPLAVSGTSVVCSDADMTHDGLGSSASKSRALQSVASRHCQTGLTGTTTFPDCVCGGAPALRYSP